MKIAVLSRDETLYSTRRLLEAGAERGHEMLCVDYLRCYVNITAHKPSVVFKGEPLEGVDAVIPRIAAGNTFYGTAVVRQFEMMDVFPANGSQAIARSRDKLRSLQILSRRGIGLPVTGFAHSTTDVDGLIDVAGGTPLVVKLLDSTHGVGVVLAETRKAAEAVIDAFRGLNANFLVQEYIKEAKGTDVRAFVVGKRVVAAMQRTGAPGDFRSSLHRGGKAEKVKLTPEERSTAVRSVRAMGLSVAGVDMLRSNHGPVVIEINSSPGLEGTESSTGIDVAAKIVKFLEENAGPGKSRDRVGL